MSGTMRLPADAVRVHAETLVRELGDLCEKISIGGSLRRGKSNVGDVEIVVLPKSAPSLLARLDRWVWSGKVKKALYSDGSLRWGEKYRGLMYEGIRFEIFLADRNNWGYILWLRTGPGDANQYVMQRLIGSAAPYGPQEGYWWASKRKLCVADEGELFRLLGAPGVIPADQRSILRYSKFMLKPTWATTLTYADVIEKPPIDTVMF